MTTAPTRQVDWTRPWLYPKQEAAIYCPERIAVVEASTKSGKTVVCLTWLLEIASTTGREGRNYWWIAPIYPQARIAFERAKRGLIADNITIASSGEIVTKEPVSQTNLFSANNTNAYIKLTNGATVWFKGAEDPDSLYGEDVFAAVMDEYTRCKQASWIALRTTLTATHGPVRLIGNVKGKKNWGYQLARQAEAGASDMHYARLTAEDAVEAGIFNKQEIADARAVMPEHEWQQLYYAIAADDDGNPFGSIAAITRQIPSLMPPAVWGWDLAKSSDWTVGVPLDENGNMGSLQRWQHLPWNQTELRIAQATGDSPALIDSTGVGDPIVEALQRGAEDAIPPRRPIVAEGYAFTQPSKQKLMEGLAAAIQSLEITVVEGPVTLELEQFEYHYTSTGVRYSAPEGMHDDCVMALALAVNLYKRRPQRFQDDGANGMLPRSREVLSVTERDALDDMRDSMRGGNGNGWTPGFKTNGW